MKRFRFRLMFYGCALRPRAAQGREAAGFPDMSGLTVKRLESRKR